MKNHYAVWLKNTDGAENRFAGTLTPNEAAILEAKLATLRHEWVRNTGKVMDFVVVRQTSLAYGELVREITEWLGLMSV